MKKFRGILTAFVFLSLGLSMISCASTPVEEAPVEEAPPPVAPPPPVVKPEAPTGPALSLDITGAKKYTVKQGDTLAKIAGEQYKDNTDGAFYFPIIMKASEDLVKNPDFILPRMVLTVPDLQRNLASADTKAYVNSLLIDAAKYYEAQKRYSGTTAGLRAIAAK